MTREEALHKWVLPALQRTWNEKRVEEILKALEQEPCEDAISRARVVEWLHNCTDDSIEHAIDSNIEFIPSVTPKPRWIPVSERLPEDRGDVLVTAYWHETYQVMMASYYGDGLWWCVPFNNCGEHMQKLKPIAWMPPFLEPYKEESEE